MSKSLISKRTELEELQHQAGHITDQSLECTRRMLNLVEESEEAGKRTAEALEVQREQLNNIEQNMDHINADVSKAEISLRKLKSCCCTCPTPSKKNNNQMENEVNFQNGTQESPLVVTEQPRRGHNSKETQGNGTTQAFITPITNDDREDEMNANLNQINSIVGNLRNMAVDMNIELKTHNTQIERIILKGDANRVRLDQVNISATKLVNDN